jgi:hypothetical protein
MNKNILIAGLAGAVLIPSIALAATPCEQQSANRAAGTVAGAGLGALAGSAIAGRGSHTEGALIGGVAGALLGNQLSRGSLDCSHAYGYYDDRGMWHATGVANSEAQGYWDRNNRWVSGPPTGYYNASGQWVSGGGDASAAGYYDANGYWVPAATGGYYDRNGRWVSAAPGYWRNGRWISGASVGRYDESGNWIPGQAPGHVDGNGVWVSDPQPGYWDQGRWVRGQVYGYYDARGRWASVRSDFAAVPSGSSGYAYTRSSTDDADLVARIDRTQRRIRRDVDQGRISASEGNRALRRLDEIRSDEQRLNERLDEVRNDLRLSRED